MSTAIKVENLSKAYQLGTIGTGTLSRDLERWIARVRGKEDPFLTIGEANDRSVKGTSDVVLSLNNISFDIEQGDAVGIIGRNGAGKSTLLKLLSRVTSPTSGSIKVKGRIASLLEVGTGFHPELTGRENIYLNGAILGMRKKEIARKFDQIVDFSGVERYIDTPVKRYSSGMYVRLAFAVAAHLESEILIVDEVLAVGDAEFQKKCLGKMKDVSEGEGRTVLFVSHNMAAVKSLCEKAILLSKGSIETKGKVSNVLDAYFLNNNTNSQIQRDISKLQAIDAYFVSWSLDKKFTDVYKGYSREPLTFYFKLICSRTVVDANLGFIIRNTSDEIIYGVNSRDSVVEPFAVEPGQYIFSFTVSLPIAEGNYVVDIALGSDTTLVDHWISNTQLQIINDKPSVMGSSWSGVVTSISKFGLIKE